MCYKKKFLRHFQGNSRTLNIHFKHSLSALASLSLVLFDQSFLAFRCLFSLFVNLRGRPLPWFLCLHCILHLSSYFFAYPRLCLASISFSTLYLPTSVSHSCLSWPFYFAPNSYPTQNLGKSYFSYPTSQIQDTDNISFLKLFLVWCLHFVCLFLSLYCKGQ